MATQLIIASNNPFKTAELQKILADYQIDGVPYYDIIGRQKFPPETTTSFRQNVNTKAQFISHLMPEQMVIADDSGITLEACPQKLGVVTSRQLAPYQPNYVAHMLTMVDGKSRHFTMRSFTTIAHNGQVLATGMGVLTGNLATTLRGQDHDGFDCVLIPDGLTKTLNQLPHDEWLKYAHRAKAVRQVLTNVGLLKGQADRDNH